MIGATLGSLKGSMLTIRKFRLSLWKALVDTIMHDGIEHAGYLAFLSLLSLFPFLVFLFALAGFIGESEIGERFIEILLTNMPSEVITSLKPRLMEIASGPPQGLLTLAIVGAIWTASSAVEGLRTILNRAYRVATPPAYIWRRLLSILQFFIITGVITIAMLGLIIAPAVWDSLQDYVAIEKVLHPVWTYFRYLLVFSILFLCVATFYYILPNIKQRWRSVVPGALIVVVAWGLAGTLLTTYLSNFNQVNIIYGSLGGVIAALLFFYLMSMIFIFGAEFNYHIELALGHRLEQKEAVAPSVET